MCYNTPRIFKTSEVIVLHRIFLKMFLLIFVPAVLIGCGREDTPQNAFDEIKNALAERNSENLSERVNLENFFAVTYDEITLELAAHCDEYSKKYPEDPYFQRGGDFLKNYNEIHRDRHLDFLRGVEAAFYMKIPEPEKPEENPHAYLANEFENTRRATIAKIVDTKIDGDRAIMTVNLSGDNSLYGHFIGQIEFKFAFEKSGEKWKLVKIENLPEILPQIVDKAELVWVTFYQ